MLQTGLAQDAALNDEDLRHRVVNFLHGRGIKTAALRVEAGDGIVYLYGGVPNDESRESACNCCRRVAGVRDVICGLSVDESAADAPSPSRSLAMAKPR